MEKGFGLIIRRHPIEKWMKNPNEEEMQTVHAR